MLLGRYPQADGKSDQLAFSFSFWGTHGTNLPKFVTYMYLSLSLYIYIYIGETCAWTPNNVFLSMIVVESLSCQFKLGFGEFHASRSRMHCWGVTRAGNPSTTHFLTFGHHLLRLAQGLPTMKCQAKCAKATCVCFFRYPGWAWAPRADDQQSWNTGYWQLGLGT